MIINVEHFKSWLRRKPMTTTYDYYDGQDCIIARYLKENNFPVGRVEGSHWIDIDGISHEIPRNLATAVIGHYCKSDNRFSSQIEKIVPYQDVWNILTGVIEN